LPGRSAISPSTSSQTPVRLDKWLWAARFFKTRALAVEAINKNRVDVNDQTAKPSREVRVGDLLTLRDPGVPARQFEVLGVSGVRGPAPVAQQLYVETPASQLLREQARLARQQGTEPAQSLEHGRPTKRDRRQLADWNRWSASADESSDP
jgi:ribosome-associated heat shock protein Hsp15